LGPESRRAIDGTDDERDPDEEAWGFVQLGAEAGRRVPGVSRATAERIERIRKATAISSGMVPPSRARWLGRRARRWARRLGVAGLAALAGSGAVSVADRLAHPYEPPPRTTNWAPVEDPLLAIARVHDATGPTDWGMRVLAHNGRRCVTLGRLRRGRIGTRTDGRFMEFVAGAPRQCPARGEATMIRWKDFGPTTGRRSLAYGTAPRGTTIRIAAVPLRDRDRVLIHGPGVYRGTVPRGQEVPVAEDGTFIFMAVGVNGLRDKGAFVNDGRRVLVVPLWMP
jgi:hypothetical protein